ncbi:hypothetical protein BZA70DRAFT_311117 [Myxozyma melibiosi]|uniref:Calcium-activated potassium channel BK alpha subunit domain-containing protein n=1 Tax=Myxozyma melibiosi TaxID=54550 RepID=A0ABR1F647_9ASCO
MNPPARRGPTLKRLDTLFIPRSFESFSPITQTHAGTLHRISTDAGSPGGHAGASLELSSYTPDSSLQQVSALALHQRDLDKRRETPSAHDRALFIYEATRVGRIYDLVDAVVSTLFCILYLWNTRYARVDDTYQALPLWSKVCERLLAILMLLMYIPRYYFYSNKLDYFFSIKSVVTWLSVFSVLLAWIVDDTRIGPDIDLSYMSAGDFVFLYPARFVRVSFSILQTLLPVKTVYLELSPLSRELLRLATTFFSAVLTISAVIHIVSYKALTAQDKPPDSTFFDSFFFTVIGTVTGMRSTSVPDTRFTRVVNLFVIAAGFLWLPKQLAKLISVINSQSPYERKVSKTNKENTYVIISGEPELTEQRLANFLHEFLHIDHGVMQSINLKCTVLRPVEPRSILKQSLLDPHLSSRVSYLVGTAMSFRSLSKARGAEACAAFLLASRTHGQNLDDADAQQMMRALSLCKFNSNLRIFVEVHLRENVANFDFLAENVVCKQDIVDGLLAQSVLVPGLSTILVLLATSIGDDSLEQLHKVAASSHMPWMREYLNSLGQEFYTSDFHSSFVGLKFIEAVQLVHRFLGVLVVGYGIEQKDNIRRNTVKISSDPEYVLMGEEVCITIASDVYDADRVSQFDVSQHLRSAMYTDETFTPADLNARVNDPVVVVSGEADNTPQSMDGVLSSRQLHPLVIPVSRSDSNDGSRVLPPGARSRSRSPVPTRRQKSESNSSSNSISKDGFENHVLICDCSDRTTRSFDVLFHSIRNSPDAQIRNQPIVVLTKNPSIVSHSDGSCSSAADDEEHANGVIYIPGNPTDVYDLQKAGAGRASRCLILSDEAQAPDTAEITADARVLLTALNFEAINDRAGSMMVIECLREDTIKLIGQTRSIECSDDRLKQFLRPSFMSGNVVCPAHVDVLTSQSFYNPFIAQIFETFILRDSESSSSQVLLLPVPKSMQGKSYGSLVSLLLRGSLPREGSPSEMMLDGKPGIPLGLRREMDGYSYVAINAAETVVLRASDAVYVIRHVV